MPSSALNPLDHLGLLYKHAHSAARRYGGQTEEYLGAGYIALLNACRTFKPELGIRPSTHIVRALSWKLYEDSMQRRGFRKIGSGSREGWHQPPLSGGIGVEGTIEQNVLSTPDKANQAEESVRAYALLRKLTWIEQKVLLDRLDDRLLREIGADLGLSRERVRQIEKSARDKLKRMSL